MRPYIIETKNAEAWKERKVRFSEKESARLFELQRSLSNIVQGNLSGIFYFTQIKRLWDEFDSMLSFPYYIDRI